MVNYNDVYMIPEQIADKLQVGTATIYRWLRSGKLKGVRISTKAWRISERDFESFLNRQNPSEMLFEDYLDQQGLADRDYEPSVAGKKSRIDCRVRWNGQALWFEVTEFGEVDVGGGGAYDPYIAIRNKIGRAAAQFSEYEGECCSVVLYNDKINLASVYAPEIVLGAMLGNVSVRVPVDFETGAESGPTSTFFSDGGKMVHPHLKTPRNTAVSAVIALEQLGIGGRQFRVMLARKEADENRVLPWSEFHELFQSDLQAHTKKILRVLVYENPYAASPLPKEIFNGSFDERWGPVLDQPYIKRLTAGSELLELEKSEHEFELDLSPIQKLMQGKPRARRSMD
jgi:excisionase family DNA binding protein